MESGKLTKPIGVSIEQAIANQKKVDAVRKSLEEKAKAELLLYPDVIRDLLARIAVDFGIPLADETRVQATIISWSDHFIFNRLPPHRVDEVYKKSLLHRNKDKFNFSIDELLQEWEEIKKSENKNG